MQKNSWMDAFSKCIFDCRHNAGHLPCIRYRCYWVLKQYPKPERCRHYGLASRLSESTFERRLPAGNSEKNGLRPFLTTWDLLDLLKKNVELGYFINFLNLRTQEYLTISSSVKGHTATRPVHVNIKKTSQYYLVFLFRTPDHALIVKLKGGWFLCMHLISPQKHPLKLIGYM